MIKTNFRDHHPQTKTEEASPPPLLACSDSEITPGVPQSTFPTKELHATFSLDLDERLFAVSPPIPLILNHIPEDAMDRMLVHPLLPQQAT
ncbi:hypothetical protein B9Z55_026162 [Caenorhabditis nigoni]|uniref:Uncharacterized protein n=1 Tax=Caenorhabditis nigoni TaxID=1611254 RepID=A0A2G5T273_9PELO|nr:hypothetical protein B9Z55_026162 [Caenorhabditis nigoni]